MGFSIGDVKSAINKGAEALGVKSPFDTSTTSATSLEEAFTKDAKGNTWTINGADWYQVYGYQFSINMSDGKTTTADKFTFTLPIPPQSFMVKPVMATRATPTIGGVVEETSPVTFWMIQMQGTTGIATARGQGDEANRKEMAKSFRDNITTTGLLSGLSANLNKVVSKIGGVADQAIDAFGRVKGAFDDKKNPLSAIPEAAAGFVGAANTALLPPLPYSTSAVSQNGNGFTEAQELQKFFYMYSKIKGQSPDKYSLKFKCYKTNQEWQCIVKEFSLQISAQNPNLYKYSISLQGWDCKAISDKDKIAFDRLSPTGDLKSVNTITSKSAKKLSTKLLGF